MAPSRRWSVWAVLGTVCGAVGAPAAAQAYKFFDNGEYALIAQPNAGTLEPPVAVTLNGVPVNNPATPGADVFEVIELWDRVPGTGSYPLTMADIIASGYTRPLVQKAGGGGGGIGTSVVVGPSFRAAGAPLDLIPEMQSAAVTIGGTDRFTIQTTGTYSAKASYVAARSVPDPVSGKTVVHCTFQFEAVQNITLPGDPKGKGFDAFRFFMLSSMLADLSLGQYDANFLVTENAAGQRKTVAIPDAPRGVHLFAAPRATAIGRGFGLYKDKQATWNPESPSVEIRIDAIEVKPPSSGPITPLIGVQGYLAMSTNPNDDSLNVWLEWLDSPATIAAGTVVSGEFSIVATHPTDRGDLDHDGSFTCMDHALLANLMGQTPVSPTFDAYGDLDGDEVITESDRQLLMEKIGELSADCDGDGVLAIDDFICFQTMFAVGDPYADCDGSGALSIDDFICFQTLFAVGGCG